MKQLHTLGIVLARTNYGEADRIVTMLTPDHGKLRLMVRGARKPKSRLAGGVELFSVSDITFIKGRGEIDTLISARLRQHFGRIVRDINRVQQGYGFIKLLNKSTADHPEPDYFDLLAQALSALDNQAISTDLVAAWFQAQLLRLAGHTPNLKTDVGGQPLESGRSYSFDFDDMAFQPSPRQALSANHIKALRLLFSQDIISLHKVEGLADLLPGLAPLVRGMAQSHD